jgi:XTP/dITP diphosphohydrolase
MLKRERSLYFMTSNESKYREVKNLALEFGIDIKILKANKIEIQSQKIEEIVKTAAILAYQHFKVPLILEDTGLFIEALNGFPGPYSSYVYNTIGCEGIIKLMEGIKNRNAKFATYVCYIDSSSLIVFSGEIEGTISNEIRGKDGFGFDPIFIPKGSYKSFGEMTLEEKNKISHRASAFRKLFSYLATYI